MKKLKTLLPSTLISLSILMIGITPVFADSNNPYNPYEPHKPVPTGFADLEIVSVLSGLFYLGGLTLISYSNYMNKKLVK
jgi:hypothetical protein